MKHSGYFRGALSGTFKEAEEGVVVLEDEDAYTLAVFNTWLYTKKLECVLSFHTYGVCLAPVYKFGDR